MNTKTQSSINRIADRARARYAAWIASARQQTEQAAGRVRDGKKPVKKLSQLGHKLTTVSYRTTTRMLDQQTRMVERQIDALATRLRTAAKADTIVDLVRDQMQLVPEEASRFAADARATLAIVADAGGEMRDIITGTVADIRGTKSAPKKKSPTKKAQASKPARKTKAKTAKAKAGKAAAAKAAPAAPADVKAA